MNVHARRTPEMRRARWTNARHTRGTLGAHAGHALCVRRLRSKAGHRSNLASLHFRVNATTERRKHTQVEILWITQRFRTIDARSDQLPGTFPMDVNTNCSQLIGNTAIVRKRCVIHTNSTCVCWRLSVATFTETQGRASMSRPCYRRQDARVEHSLLEKLTLFPNASIVLEDVDTRRAYTGRLWDGA